MKNFKLNQLFGLSVIAVALGACGPQAYVPGTVQSDQSAAGTMYIPPKVDIVLSISQDGTMRNVYPQIQAGIQNLTASLKAKNWDYRFVAISASEYQTNDVTNLTGKVSTSYYDGAYAYYPGNLWIPPFPGASPTNPFTTLASSLFNPQFTYPVLDQEGSHNNAHEWGVKNQLKFLQDTNVQSGFLRSDAQLAFITVSTGDDHSTNLTADVPCNATAPADVYGYWKQRTNGNVCLSDANYYSNTNSKVNYFHSQVNAVKSASLVKYYSVVAMPADGSSMCSGNAIRRGTDYQTIANSFNGKTIDLCANGIDNAMTQVGNDLNSNQAIYRKRYLVLKDQPKAESIQVKKVSSGISQSVLADSTNGWTYAGPTSQCVVPVDAFKLQNDPTWYPYNGPQVCGYIIELHGSAILTGDDSASVSYMNIGGVVVAQ